MQQPHNPYAPPGQPHGPPQQVMIPAHDANLEMRLQLTGSAAHARQMLGQVLAHMGWQLQPSADGWSGMATKGNKTMNMLFGAFAQYHEIHFAFQALPDGTGELILYRLGSGCMGGLLGMYQVRKSFKHTSQSVYQAMAQQGLVMNVIGRSS